MIEALLAVFGITLADNVLSDNDKDTEVPVITVLGDNPAVVELGATYTDA